MFRSAATKSIPLSTTSPSTPKPVSTSAGDRHTDLDQIDIRLEKNHHDSLPNSKHSINNSTTTSTSSGGSGFSLKNPVSSFRSWVSNKKTTREESGTSSMNHSMTTYGKIDTSPTPRKSSISSSATRRNRTNSASATTTTSVLNHHQQQNQTNSSSPSTTTGTTRVKKKSSFALRNTNPISLLKRTSDTSHNQANVSPTEQAGTSGGGGGAGPFGYFKNLVRGDSSSSEKKQ